ncbi:MULTISPECIES: xanthine dehydrogenase family protein subunit M [unclassified Streptomyces]|uniref:FAD binding domain-containing protein n=1 Tax=unclassified Streptomyces TaxID=2593676 RepID=UPI000A7F4535|nr:MULTISPECIES: xanthine dehydrogenase family protein subunit M [unclassified Streptomyces]MBT2405087.1 xanthine dehydrogenase family protein subunit M [Streptomyces sp. ISL-21]MBT2610813.1 xanthine dehydrogenase family protein subunit M [Streptomyces sp. ISL-87]MDT0520041.1 xanthine dehydrogenase family protein subunit M [Streptomyces sp. DSM 41633]MDX3536449.1 xanthine dehydrogenase family protein subunit M [Streptomyces sp. MB09-01]
MDFLRPASWEEALAAKAEFPTAVPIAGGTDVMVEINFDHRRPEYLLDLNRIGLLREWEVGEDVVRLGASVPYTQIMENLRTELPGLALASHTVASPQIRNRGGVGGNLGCASPAGDSHPALLAAGAEVEVESVRGSRLIPIDEFYTGVKRNALAADELIKTIHVKKADGPQQYSKVGSRNAMVIAVCAFGLALHPETRTVRTGIGSAAPTPIRAKAAEEFLNAALEEGGFWESGKVITPSIAKQFGDLASGAANPIDDVRGTAKYRRHAVGIMARRQLVWTWEQYRGTGNGRSLEGAA